MEKKVEKKVRNLPESKANIWIWLSKILEETASLFLGVRPCITKNTISATITKKQNAKKNQLSPGSGHTIQIYLNENSKENSKK